MSNYNIPNKTWDQASRANFSFFARPSKETNKLTSVATFGSCFANEIRHSLNERGVLTYPLLTSEFKHHISKKSFEIPSWGAYDERIHLQYYNPGSLAQEIKRSINQFQEEDCEIWSSGDNRSNMLFADPYKRFLFAEDIDSLLSARRILNKLIIDAFVKAKTIILTLGLIECFVTEWGNYACLPPTIRDKRAIRNNAFKVMGFEESFEIFNDALKEFLSVYPDKQIILTTSPIPLDRTFRDLDIVVANSESKSVLRTLCGEMERRYSNVIYFPSYEKVITDPRSWELDHRHVTRQKVDEIIADFMSYQSSITNANGVVFSEENSSPIYERQWQDTDTLIFSSIESGRLSANPTIVEIDNFLDKQSINFSVEESQFWVNGKPYVLKNPDIVNIQTLRQFFTRRKIELIREAIGNTDTVIELGAGFAGNLFRLAKDQDFTSTANYHAFELTRSGRQLANKLSVLLNVSVHTHRFNFFTVKPNSPELSFDLSGGKISVFTSYAIEQIQQLPESFLDWLLSIRNLVRVVRAGPSF